MAWQDSCADAAKCPALRLAGSARNWLGREPPADDRYLRGPSVRAINVKVREGVESGRHTCRFGALRFGSRPVQFHCILTQTRRFVAGYPTNSSRLGAWRAQPA